MSVTYPLDKFLKKIDKSDAKSIKFNENRKIIYFNSKEGAKTNIPKFSFKEWDIFRLSLNDSVNYKTKYIVTDFLSDQSIELNIRYQVSLEKDSGSIEKNCLNVVTILSTLNHPAEALNKLISIWIKEYVDIINGKDNFIYMYFSNHYSKYLNEYIQLEAKKVGLNLKTAITLEHEEDLKVYEIKTDKFPIYTKDSLEEQNLSFTISLEVDEENKINAILRYNNLHELKDKIKNKIKAFIKGNVSFHEFTFKIKEQSERIRKDEKLIDFLRKEGRIIESIVFSTDINTPEDKHSKVILHTSKCHIKGYDEKIDVKHDLLIELEDLGIYKYSGVNNLEARLVEILDSYTQNELFKKTYSEILLDFETENSESKIACNIKSNVEMFIRNIGYKVTQIITLPALQPIEFIRNGFSFERFGDFPTKTARIDVNLSFFFSGRIKSLHDEKIKYLLHPTIDLEEEIWKIAKKKCVEIMHSIDPVRFYFKFDIKDEVEKTSVKDKLIEIIKQNLESELNLSIEQITPKQQETEISKRFDNLVGNNPHIINVSLNSLTEDVGVQDISYVISFNVINVDSQGFASFASKTYSSLEDEIKFLKLAVERNIKEVFSLLGQEQLQYKDLESYGEIIKVQGFVIEKIRKSFGILIGFESINREATEIEIAIKIANINSMLSKIKLSGSIDTAIDQSKKEQLNNLLKALESLRKLGVEEEDEEYVNIKNSIEKIRTEFSIGITDSHMKKLKSSTGNKRTDINKLFKLTSGELSQSEKLLEDKKIEDEE